MLRPGAGPADYGRRPGTARHACRPGSRDGTRDDFRSAPTLLSVRTALPATACHPDGAGGRCHRQRRSGGDLHSVHRADAAGEPAPHTGRSHRGTGAGAGAAAIVRPDFAVESGDVLQMNVTS